MNLYLPENELYAEMVLSLSGAAACAMVLTIYGDTLNVDTLHGSRQMFLSSAGIGLVMFLFRGLHYPVIVFRVLSMFWAEGWMKFFAFCLPVFLLFEMINIIYTVSSVKRVFKFWDIYKQKSSGKTVGGDAKA